MSSFKEILEESALEAKATYINKLVSYKGKVDDMDVKKVKDMLSDYDWFTFAIDDGAQKRKAETENAVIKNKLKLFGVKAIYHDDFSVPMSGKIKKEISI